MANEQTLEVLEKIRPNIQKLAFTFIHKMKKPSPYSIQDLLQEGEETVLQQLTRDRPDDLKGKETTYLIRSVITRFIDLMHKSYKSDTPLYFNSQKSNSNISFKVVFEKVKIEELNVLVQVMEMMSTREKEYITIMINPPEYIQEKFTKDRRGVRKHIRNALNMSQKEERTVRKEIERKLMEIKG